MLYFIYFFSFVFTCAAHHAGAQTPVGVWATFDDETGEQKATVQIYMENEKLFGKITSVSRPSLNHRCDKCEGTRKNQYVLGMVIIEDMVAAEGHWQGGQILFPRQGRWYGLKFWLAPEDANILVIRGNMGPFYKTQYWRRVAE